MLTKNLWNHHHRVPSVFEFRTPSTLQRLPSPNAYFSQQQTQRSAVGDDEFFLRSLVTEFDRVSKEMELARRQIEPQQQQQQQSQSKSWKREWKSESPNSKIYVSESFTILTNGPDVTARAIPASTTPAALPGQSFLIFLGWFAIAFYAGTTRAFVQGYHATKYAEKLKFVVVLAWPLLALISSDFRNQLRLAVTAARSIRTKEQMNTIDNGGYIGFGLSSGNEKTRSITDEQDVREVKPLNS